MMVVIMKKIFSILAILALCFSGVSATVFGENDAEAEKNKNHLFEVIDENNINVSTEEVEVLNVEKCDLSNEHIDENGDAVCDICQDELVAYILRNDKKIYYETFEEAITDAQDKETVYLIRDAVIKSVVTIDKNITITSHSTQNPCQITTKTNSHGYLLNIADKEVVLENIIVDGGSVNKLTSKRALIAVNGGTLKVQKGALIRNNNNTTSQGVGGGICVISGNAYIDGATFENNSAYFGGGVGMTGGICEIQSSSFTNNFASIGGGICVWELRYKTAGTLYLLDNVVVKDNEAQYYAGGINCNNNGRLYIKGNIFVKDNKSDEETNSGIYLDGNDSYGRSFAYIGELSENAELRFSSFNPPKEMLVASPWGEHQITKSDMKKMSYDSNILELKLFDDGCVYLVCAHNNIDENGNCTDCDNYKVPIYSVEISADKEDGIYAYDEAITLEYNISLSENSDAQSDIQWFIDGINTKLTSLTFKLASGTHEIYCIATNREYSVKSNVLTIKVNEKTPNESTDSVIPTPTPSGNGNNTVSNNKVPQTSDDSDIWLWTALAIINAALLFALWSYGNGKKFKEL